MTRPFNEDLHAVKYPLMAESREDETHDSLFEFSQKAKARLPWFEPWVAPCFAVTVILVGLVYCVLVPMTTRSVRQAALRPPQKYKVSLIQPDGKTYETHELTAPSLRVFGNRNGQTVNRPSRDGYYEQVLYDAPIGWLWKIEPVAEKEDK